MSPHQPTSTPPGGPRAQSLAAEERALAERLARLGPQGEPSPALDSRILAAAHAAATQHGASAAKRTTRLRGWPVQLGLAASLILAIGVAWQLRQLPDAGPAYRSEADSALPSTPLPAAGYEKPSAAAVPNAGTDPKNAPQEPADVSARVEDQRRPLAPGRPDEADAFPAAADTAGKQRAATATGVAAPTAQAPVVLDAPATAADRLHESVPPPAPAAPPPSGLMGDAAKASAPSQSSQAPAAFRARNDEVGAASAAAKSSSPPQSMQSDAARSKASSAAASRTATMPVQQAAQDTANDNSWALDMPDEDIPIDDMPAEDVPPATAAAPAVREAWLARIRELTRQGRLDQARDSLQVFRARYPDYRLPDDLRALDREPPLP